MEGTMHRYRISSVYLLIVSGILSFAPGAWARTFYIPGHFETIQQAVDSADVVDGDRLLIRRGRHAGAVLNKRLVIAGRPGAIIDSGPIFIADYPCIGEMRIGFQLGFNGAGEGSGSTIQNLEFDNLAFPVYGRDVDDVRVIGNTMRNPIQGVTNRGGSDWRILYNRIRDLRTANGGGIGIFITDASAREGGVIGNHVSYNDLSGTVHVSSCELGGYDASGVVLNADFRNGAMGAEEISENIISWNRIALVSDAPSMIDVVGIVLEDSRNDDCSPPIIVDNIIWYNDLHRLDTAFLFAPTALEDSNVAVMNWIHP